MNADEYHTKNANLIFSKQPSVLNKLSLVVECNKNYKNDDWTDRQPDIKRAPLLPKCAIEEYREQKEESSDIKKKMDSKMEKKSDKEQSESKSQWKNTRFFY